MQNKNYRPSIKLLNYFISIFLCIIFIGTSINIRALAFSPNYNANNLIDNPTFINAAAMSASSIQTFLNSLGSGLATYSTLEDCSNSVYGQYYANCGKTVSAAQIIYDASQVYGISPRVIIATLQKEQSLITLQQPNQSDPNAVASYNASLSCAVGYDSCQSSLGFFGQIDSGSFTLAYNYQAALKNSSWLGTNPSSKYPCSTAAQNGLYSNGLLPGNVVTFTNPGGTPVTIQIANAATASLYCYTPYVGPYSQTGYSGSYNFVYYYQLWFGSTQVSTPYAWEPQPSLAYEDSGYTIAETDTITTQPGQTIYAEINALNVGYQDWNASLKIGTSNPNDRLSVFSNNSWVGANRPAAITQPSVSPGQIGTFRFSLTAPSNPGTYVEYFNPVIDGLTWLNNGGFAFTINVVSPGQTNSSTNYSLLTNKTLLMNESIISQDSNTILRVQDDGNLVLYQNFKPLWSTGTYGNPGAKLVMQTDGNLVLYSSNGTPLWNAGTNGNNNAYLNLQTDGNLVLYSSNGTPLWNTGTVHVPNLLYYVNNSLIMNSLVIFPGQEMQTANRNFAFVMQPDGNLVLYGNNGYPLWLSNTLQKNTSSTFLRMQSDGNLVLYGNAGTPLWSTGTYGNPGAKLVMQTDGNLVLYSSNDTPLWSTGTGGKVNFLNTNKLLSGQSILSNQNIISTDLKINLILQADGNLVLYSSNGTPLWNAGTNGNNKSYLNLQTDGNLVLYSSNGTPLWNTGTSAKH